MKIEPSHLEILAAVVDHGGVTEGARAINKSQPSVSRTLNALEERIGIALFEPNRRPLKPTHFGLLLAAEGRKVQAVGQAVSSLIESHKAGRSGALRLGGTPIFMDGVITPIIAAFQSKFPEVQLHQSYGYAADLLSQLRNAALDVAIAPLRTDETPQDLSAVQILRGENVIACRVGHPLLRAGKIRLAEIAEYPWIAPPPNSPLYHDLRAALDGVGVNNFRVSFSGGSLASVTSILGSSDSLTVLPKSVVDNLIRQKTHGALAVPIGDPDRHLHVLSANREVRPASASLMVDYVCAHFGVVEP